MKPDETWDLRVNDSMLPAFPKPGQIKRPAEPVKVFADGREVCECKTEAGREEYKRRKRLMWERQNKRCILEGICPTCPGKLRWGEATFEHEKGRGSGGSKRDDRIEINGKRTNGVAHIQCNGWKASRSIQYSEEEGG